jgi:hypothetical protein
LVRHVGEIITRVSRRYPSSFANSFRTVAITRHDHGDDGFLYACNFGVMASWRIRMVYKYHLSAVPIFYPYVGWCANWVEQVQSEILLWSVDITSIAYTIDVTINLLRRHYLGVNFGTTTKHLGIFLRNMVPIGDILYVYRFGCEKMHILHCGSMPGCDVGGSLKNCITLGRLLHPKCDWLTKWSLLWFAHF